VRHLLLILPFVFLAGCESSPPRTDDLAAQRAAIDAWGVGFGENRYDIERQLSKEQQAQLAKELSKKTGETVSPSGVVITLNAPPESVVEEIKRLDPGTALAFCKTWRTEKRSGDVIETGVAKPGKPVPFGVVTRAADGSLHASRFEAQSHEEALRRK